MEGEHSGRGCGSLRKRRQERTWCIQGDADGPIGRARRRRCGSRSVGLPCDLEDRPEVVVLAQAARTKDCRLRASHSSGG